MTEGSIRYYEKVYRFFRRRVSSRTKAQDLTHETFLRVSKGVGELRAEEKVEAWVMTIAGNVLRSDLRRQGAAKRSGTEVEVDRVDTEKGRRQMGPPKPLQDLLQKEQADRVRSEIGRLPPRERQVIVLRYLQERSLEEIASILQISKNTVKTHLRQGLARLRKALGDLLDLEAET